MAEFNIVKWLSGRLGYEIPTQTLENIALERGIADITDFADLTQKDKDLTLADCLFYIYTTPTQTASESKSHGDFTHSKGSQIITDKRNLYTLMMGLYRKWGDPMADMIEESQGGVQWLDY